MSMFGILDLAGRERHHMAGLFSVPKCSVLNGHQTTFLRLLRASSIGRGLFFFSPNSYYKEMGFSILAKKNILSHHDFLRVTSLSGNCVPLASFCPLLVSPEINLAISYVI